MHDKIYFILKASALSAFLIKTKTTPYVDEAGLGLIM